MPKESKFSGRDRSRRPSRKGAMKIRVKVWVLGTALVCLAASAAYAQSQPASGDSSLADIARQIKAQKAKEPKPVRVMTNETIENGGTKTDFGAAPSKKPSGDTSPTEPAKSDKHDAAYFRAEQSRIQGQLDTHNRELSVLQQKLGQNQTQYYANPQDSLMQQYSREDINKLTDEINAKKQQVADDEKAMDDLREQLRHEGGDPGWLR